MDRRSDGGAAIVVVACVLLLLLVVAAGGALYVFRSQRSLMAEQFERAQIAEAQARLNAQSARRDAHEIPVTRAAADDVLGTVAQDDAVARAVESVLGIQEKAWNDGDLDGFMAHYWNSEDLTFSSGGDTTRGWNATMKRYRERYPTNAEMGRLTLSDFEITPLGNSAALVLGKWKVERESEPLEGNFSLVMRTLEGRWVVIHDHTSRTPAEE